MQFLKKAAKTYLLIILILPIILLTYTSIIYFFGNDIPANIIEIISFFVNIIIYMVVGIISGLMFKKRGLLVGALIALILFLVIFFIHIITKSINIQLIIRGISGIISSGFLAALCCKNNRKKA